MIPGDGILSIVHGLMGMGMDIQVTDMGMLVTGMDITTAGMDTVMERMEDITQDTSLRIRILKEHREA